MKNPKIRWITETALMLALLIVVQAATKPLGQLVTGSCVNGVLAISALFVGGWSGVLIALVSPVLAFLLGLAPNVLVVPAIMLGNLTYVVLLFVLTKESVLSRIAAWLVASAAKFAVLYLVVSKIICGVASSWLMGQGLLKEQMLKVLPVTFGVTQLFTALIGGFVAILIAPVLRKALHRTPAEKE